MSKEEVLSKAEDTLLTVLEKGIEKLEAGADFMGDQIPLLVQELLLFKGAIAVLCLMIGLAILFGATMYFHKLREQYKFLYPKRYELEHMSADSLEFCCVVTWFAKWLSILIGFVVTFFNALDLLKIILAPRLYLLEYAATLVK